MRAGLRSAAILAIALLGGCGTDTLGPDNQQLSDALSITNLVKTPIPDPSNAGRFVGLIVDVDVVNTAFFPISRAFRVTWALRENERSFAQAATVVRSGLSPGGSAPIHLRIDFPSRESLMGVSDVVLFDLIE